MRHLVVMLIKTQPKGTVIRTRGLYAGIFREYPNECRDLGFTNSDPIEPKWKNGIRFGLRDARDQGLITHIGLPKSGEWQRV